MTVPYSYTAQLGASVSSRTLTVDTPVTNKRLGILKITAEGSASNIIVGSATFNGTACTFIDGQTVNSSNRVELWHILDADLPAAAGSYSCVVTMGGLCSVIAEMEIYDGMVQAAPEATNKSPGIGGTSLSTSITTVSNGALVVDVITGSDVDTSMSPDAGQTSPDFGGKTYLTVSTMTTGCSYKNVATAGADAMGWTFTSAPYSAQVVAAFAVYAADTTPPTVSTPTYTGVTASNASVGATTDEAGTSYVVFVANGAAAPNSNQVFAGTDGGDIAAIDYYSNAVSIGAFTNPGNSLLAASTSYDYHLIVVDAAGNKSTPPVGGTFTTSAPVQISLTGIEDEAGNLLTDTIAYKWYPDATGVGTQDFDTQNATIEAGTFAVTAGAGNVTGITAGAGWLELGWYDTTNSKWQTVGGRLTAA